MGFVIGIDGGGTKTKAALCDLNGNLLAIYKIGSSNLQNIGKENVKQVLSSVISGVITKAGVDIKDLSAICLGESGLDTNDDYEIYRDLICDIIPKGIPCELVNDAIIALHSSTKGKSGLVVVAGTGAVVAGENAQGERFRVGGWGYLVGDEGSAFDIGRHGIMEALKFEDGRGKAYEVNKAICEFFQIDSMQSLLPQIYGSVAAQTLIAGVAKTMDKLAEQGDKTALSILDQAANQLVLASKAGWEISGLEEDSPIILSGSVFLSRYLRKKVLEGINQDVKKVTIMDQKLDSVAGAIILAFKKSGIIITDEIYNNLQSWSRIERGV